MCIVCNICSSRDKCIERQARSYIIKADRNMPGKMIKAINNYHAGIRCLKESNKVCGLLAYAFNQIGDAYFRFNEPDKRNALCFYKKSEKLFNDIAKREKSEKEYQIFKAISTYSQGIAYMSQHQFDHALIFLKRALKVFTKYGDYLRISRTHLHIGFTYLFDGLVDNVNPRKLTMSKNYIRRTLQISVKRRYGEIEVMSRLALIAINLINQHLSDPFLDVMKALVAIREDIRSIKGLIMISTDRLLQIDKGIMNIQQLKVEIALIESLVKLDHQLLEQFKCALNDEREEIRSIIKEAIEEIRKNDHIAVEERSTIIDKLNSILQSEVSSEYVVHWWIIPTILELRQKGIVKINGRPIAIIKRIIGKLRGKLN